MRILVFALLLSLLVTGCRGYDDHEKLTYLDAVDAQLALHSEFASRSQDQVGDMLVGIKVDQIFQGGMDDLRRTWQGKPVDKHLKFLERLAALEESRHTYALAAGAGATHDYLASEGERAPRTEKDKADDVRFFSESRDVYQKQLAETLDSAKRARE